VLFLHGISTACHTLHPLATALAARGCRVLLFDLFGRGFSDGVGDLPHDARLYTTQALLALASSPLSWTGDDACDVVGYSMGGGVAVHLAAALPRMVRSLVLLAPAGLIRPESFGRLTRFVFAGGLVPERLLAALTRRRLRDPIARSTKKAQLQQQQAAANAAAVPAETAPRRAATHPVELLAAEVDDAGARDSPEPRALPLTLRVTAYVRWMLGHHDGFVPAFMSCVRVAPMVGQEAAWRALAASRRLPRPGGDGDGDDGNKKETKKSVCVVLAEDDEIIDRAAYEVDAVPLLGGRGHEGVAEWHVVPGGHDFPVTRPADTLKVLYDFWGMARDEEDGDEAL